jgi:protein-tyrosine-phosphatase
MAEALFRKELGPLAEEQSLRIASAGLHATPGNPAHPWALAASPDFRISLDQHRSQLLTTEMMQEADAVFAMDFQNKAELLTLYPGSAHKVFMLGACLRNSAHAEIPDPYFGDVEVTRKCYQTLQACVRQLANDLFPRSER